MSGNDLREFMRRYRPGAGESTEKRGPRLAVVAITALAALVAAGLALWLVVWYRTHRGAGADDRQPPAAVTAAGRRLGTLAGYAYTWSPDGKWIAYCAPSDQDSNPVLWRITPRGTQRERVPTDMSLPQRPGSAPSRTHIGLAWGPDGAQIVCGPAPPSGRAWTVNLDSGMTWDLGVSYAAPPHWSPDGSQLAFVQRAFDRQNRRVALILLLVSANGESAQEIGRTYSWPAPQVRQGPVWSPDGQRIIVPWDRAPVTGSATPPQGPVVDAWLIDRDGDDPHPLASAWDRRLPADGGRRVHCEYTHQCWSPDGAYVLMSAYDESRPGHRVPLGLHRVSLATGRAEPLLPASLRPDSLPADAAQRYPTWSPPGERIAFVAAGSLYVMDLQEPRCRSVKTGQRVLEAPPLWSPDGRRILYAAPAASGRGTELCVATIPE